MLGILSGRALGIFGQIVLEVETGLLVVFQFEFGQAAKVESLGRAPPELVDGRAERVASFSILARLQLTEAELLQHPTIAVLTRQSPRLFQGLDGLGILFEVAQGRSQDLPGQRAFGVAELESLATFGQGPLGADIEQSVGAMNQGDGQAGLKLERLGVGLDGLAVALQPAQGPPPIVVLPGAGLALAALQDLVPEVLLEK